MGTNARKKEVRLCSNDAVPILRRFRFSTGDEGGAVGTVVLDGPDGNAEKLPAGAIVTRVWREVRVAATSGGAATVAVGTTSSGATFDAASAYTDNDLDTVGTVALLSSTPYKVGAADEDVTATIATAALTAGEFDLIVEMIPPNAGPKFVARS